MHCYQYMPINSKIRVSIGGTKANKPLEIKQPQIITIIVLYDQYTPRLSQKTILGTQR